MQANQCSGCEILKSIEVLQAKAVSCVDVEDAVYYRHAASYIAFDQMTKRQATRVLLR